MSIRETEPIVGRRLATLTLLLGGLTAFGPLSMDLYLPAFPLLAADLHATQAQVQLTLTADVIGLVAGQLVLGPLSDARGRRRLLVGSALVCAVASLLCALAPSAAVLAAWRFVQGFSGGGGIVLARAVAADLTSGVAAARLFSLFMTLSSLAPIIAPVLGGGLLVWTGSWRLMFVVLAVVNALLTLGIWLAIPETLPEERRHAGGLGQTGRALRGPRPDRGLRRHAPSGARPVLPRLRPGRRVRLCLAFRLHLGVAVRAAGALRPVRRPVQCGVRAQRGRDGGPRTAQRPAGRPVRRPPAAARRTRAVLGGRRRPPPRGHGRDGAGHPGAAPAAVRRGGHAGPGVLQRHRARCRAGIGRGRVRLGGARGLHVRWRRPGHAPGRARPGGLPAAHGRGRGRGRRRGPSRPAAAAPSRAGHAARGGVRPGARTRRRGHRLSRGTRGSVR